MTSDKPHKSAPVQGQPLTPSPMPEYKFQRQDPSEGGWAISTGVKPSDEKKLDLSGVVLNLS